MALIEDTLFGHEDKIETAIQRLKTFEPKEGYYLAFSGGKDSQCIYHLAKMAGVKFDAHYSVTTVDSPELMRFVLEQYPDVIWDRNYWNDGKSEHYYSDGRPKQITMWNLIADHTIPPTRQARYCCSRLKETGGVGRMVVTGVRWAESVRRKALHGVADIRTESKALHKQAAEVSSYKVNKSGGIIFMDDNDGARAMVEQCYTKRKTTINPIVDWTDEDVWEFLNDYAKVPHCSLYDEGHTRLGCIGCPLQGRDGMLRDFERYPKYKELYIRAFDQMIKNHPGEIKVATGYLVEDTNGGGYSDIHRMGRMELLTDSEMKPSMRLPMQESTLTTDACTHTHTHRAAANHSSREREQNCSSDGCGCTEQTKALRLGARRGNPDVVALDAQNRISEERNQSIDMVNAVNVGGVGYCQTRQTSVRSTTTGRSLMQHGTLNDGLPTADSIDRINKNQRTRKSFNPDPRVADFENGEQCLKEWVYEFR